MEKNEFIQFAKENFPGCKTKWGGSWFFVAVSPYLSDCFHYECIGNKIAFHIEGDKWHEIRNWLKSHRNDIQTEIQPSKWSGRIDCCWTLQGSVYSDEEIKEGFLRIKELLDPTIDDFIKAKNPRPKHKKRPEPRNELLKDVQEKKSPVALLKDVSLGDILDNSLSIPDYQRIYCWRKSNVNALFRDLSEMGNNSYHLGTLILHNHDGQLDIVDGQQRLVTLTLLLDNLDYDGPLPLMSQRFDSEEAQAYIAYNKSLCQRFVNNRNLKDKKVDNLLKSLTFTVLVLNSENFDLAYTFFSNANSKGKPLSDLSLLKAHHLRYIEAEGQQKHLATRWDRLTSSDNDSDKAIAEQALRDYVLKLRQWMRGNAFDPNRKYIVRDEYVAAPTMPDIPAFGERFQFYEKIQGGQHFFNFSEKMCLSCEEYLQTEEHRELARQLGGEHWRYMEMIDALLFGYYLKFGRQYLAEALFVIESKVSRHRHAHGRALYSKIMEYVAESKIIMMIDQATSPTFFLAELFAPITYEGIPTVDKDSKPIQKRYAEQVKNIYKTLMEGNRFTDEAISNKI